MQIWPNPKFFPNRPASDLNSGTITRHCVIFPFVRSKSLIGTFASPNNVLSNRSSS